MNCQSSAMWTENVTWFSNEEGNKGNIKVAQLADLAVLDRDYFQVAEDEIQLVQSVLTIVDGKPVYGAEEFASLAPPPPPAMPDWSPVRAFGGYHKQASVSNAEQGAARAKACGWSNVCSVHGHAHVSAWNGAATTQDVRSSWGAPGCACWAF